MKEIVIPDGISVIGMYTFDGCTSLERVTIPSSVTTIEVSAFSIYQGSLSDVYYKGTETQWNSITIDDSNSALLNATLHYNS